MNELIERLEKATGPDRDLDEAVAFAAGWTRKPWRFGPVWVSPVSGVPRKNSVAHYTASLDAALTLLPLGFWWRGGTCYVSSEATVCPDHNDPEHRERLLKLCPPAIEHWNGGIEVELRPGSEFALIRALLSACLRVRLLLTTDKSP